MKVFFIGDSHAGIRPNNYQKWMKVFKQYFYEFYIPLLKRESKSGDICVHLGDLFDNRNQIPIDVLIEVMDIVKEISEILPLHIIIGNHDLFNISDTYYNTPKLFSYIPNVFIYETPKEVELGNKKVLFLPWIDKKKEQLKYLNDHKNCEYVFTHSDLNGVRTNFSIAAHNDPRKISIEEFKVFKKIFAAHIHIRQEIKHHLGTEFIYVGSTYQMDRNDRGDQKGIYILDIDNDEYQFIPNMISPVFEQVKILVEEDIEKLDKLDLNNYIDLIISNSLISSSRKIRRKLENILETKNFESVEYINDLVTETKDTKEKKENIVNEKLLIGNLSELEDIVIEYANEINYNNDKIKFGVMSNLSEIIQIYKKGYKMLD